MTRAALGRGRRWGAILLLRLAGAILRGAAALHQRRSISDAELRAALSAAGLFERAGALVALRWTACVKPARAKRNENGDDID